MRSAAPLVLAFGCPVGLSMTCLRAAESECDGEGDVGANRDIIDAVELLQRSSLTAVHAALDAFEASQQQSEGFWYGCKYASDKTCPQVACAPMMVNASCDNADLGSGRATCGSCSADELSYELVRVQTAELASAMSYAGPGSAIPEELQGIWWMDQYGVSNGTQLLACDPSFEHHFIWPATELVLSIGDTAVWNPDTQCIEEKIYYGGEKGSWSWMDESGTGTNSFWSPAYEAGAVMSFCRTQDELATYDIYIKIKFAGMGLLTPVLKLLDFKRLPDGYWQVSTELLGSFSMVKTCFGWDRVTKNTKPGHISGRVRDFLRTYLPFLRPLLDVNPVTDKEQHYAVFQVVDGRGQKTANFDVFFEWATSGSTKRGLNKGGDSMLLGRPKSR